MSVITVVNEEGLTLKDLRDFVDKCKDLPEDVTMRIDYSGINSTNVTNIQGDDESIIFYNW